MIRWYLWLDSEPHPGWHNMAVDHALLDFATRRGGERDGGLAVLRLYRWDPFCLSFGRHEPAARRYDRDRVTALGVDTVRRPTGGRAVWHARELTYAVVAPVSWGSLAAAFRRIHGAMARAVRSLGAKAALAGRPATVPRPDAGACFAAPVGGEVVVAGRKLVGSAQVRERHAFLQHGSLLLEDDQEPVRAFARAPGDTTGAAPPGEAPLSSLVGGRVAFEAAAAAVVAATRCWSDAWIEAEPQGLHELIDGHVARYRSADWTWLR